MNVAVGAALAATGEGLASYGSKVVASTEGMGALSTVAKGTNWFVNTGASYILGGLYVGRCWWKVYFVGKGFNTHSGGKVWNHI